MIRPYTSAVTSVFFEPARIALRDHLLSRDVPLSERMYRYEHCLRVAHIGRLVAEAEGLDADRLEVACLLHDIGKYDAEVAVDHGRVGSRLARGILVELGMPGDAVDDICQGIAMHVDGKWNDSPADHPGHDMVDSEPSVLARSVGDCDNVDRYSLLRIHGTMSWVGFSEMTTPQAIAWIADYRAKLVKEARYECATETADAMWRAALADHDNYFSRLAEMMAPADRDL